VGEFDVAEGPDGDALLAEVADGRRDGLSVGVFLDGATRARLRRANGAVVAASGRLREVSAVSVPAFEDARAMVGSGELVAAAAGLTRFDSSGAPEPATPTPATPADPAAPVTSPPVDPTPEGTPQTEPATQTTTASARRLVRAGAGAVTLGGQPATYSLAGAGEFGFVRDAFLSQFGDWDERGAASERIARFNAELRDGNPATVHAFMRAAGDAELSTFADIPSPAERADVGVAGYLPANVNRGDLMLRAVDAGRPIASRLNRIAINNAQPFLVPIEGEFDGVAEHTEGTPHVAPGTFSISDAPVTPRAMSGAYVISRELADATNPAIDSIVLRAMLRDYRRVSEGAIVTALMAADVTPTYAVTTAMGLRAALAAFVNDDDEPADFVAASRGLIEALYADVDADGRPMLAGPGSSAPTAAGTARAGYTGATVDGTEIVRASRAPANVGIMIRRDGVLFVESNVQQFRFEEILGPGQIKLALWAYVGAGVLRAGDVGVISAAAAP
jgi:hypothetical protein